MDEEAIRIEAILEKAKLRSAHLEGAIIPNNEVLSLQQLSSAVIDEQTALPPHLALYSQQLLETSRKILEEAQQKDSTVFSATPFQTPHLQTEPFEAPDTLPRPNA